MCISKLAFLVSVAAGTALALPALTLSAAAVQDQPTTVGDVESVCTGVGSAKDNPAWSAYPIKLVFANGAGQFVAAEHVALMQGGKTLMETDCDAPWLLLKLPAGQYAVNATLPGATARSAKAQFSMGKSRMQKIVNIDFGRAPQ